MILLLGATGYIGQAFARELRGRGCTFVPLSRSAFDYTRFELLFDYVRSMRPEFLINASGISGPPREDSGEQSRLQMFEANALLPQTIARVCLMTNTPWAHVSSGNIYSGAKVCERGEMRVEQDLNGQAVRRLFADHKDKFLGFSEMDEPNCSFRYPPCNFCDGTKAMAEEALRGNAQTFIWRCRLPFGDRDDPRNLLSKLQSHAKIHDCLNSLSHVGDFVRACLDLVDRRAPFGIYNVVNPGAVTISQIAGMIQRVLKPTCRIKFWSEDGEVFREETPVPLSSCILDVTKLLGIGVKVRPVEKALDDALNKWIPISVSKTFSSAQVDRC